MTSLQKPQFKTDIWKPEAYMNVIENVLSNLSWCSCKQKTNELEQLFSYSIKYNNNLSQMSRKKKYTYIIIKEMCALFLRFNMTCLEHYMHLLHHPFSSWRRNSVKTYILQKCMPFLRSILLLKHFCNWTQLQLTQLTMSCCFILTYGVILKWFW